MCLCIIIAVNEWQNALVNEAPVHDKFIPITDLQTQYVEWITAKYGEEKVAAMAAKTGLVIRKDKLGIYLVK